MKTFNNILEDTSRYSFSYNNRLLKGSIYSINKSLVHIDLGLKATINLEKADIAFLQPKEIKLNGRPLICPLPPSIVSFDKDIHNWKIPSRNTCHLLGTIVPPLFISIIRNNAKKAVKPIHINNDECVKEISKEPKNKGINGINSNCSNGLEIIIFYFYGPPHQYTATNKNSHTTSTKCQYQAAASKPKWCSREKWWLISLTKQTARKQVPIKTWNP